MSDHSAHSARLHALAAALCALLLLVALSAAFGVRRSAFGRGGAHDNHGSPRGPNAKRRTPHAKPGWAQGDAMPQDGWSQAMWQRHGLPGVLRVTDEDAVFWQERAQAEAEAEEEER